MSWALKDSTTTIVSVLGAGALNAAVAAAYIHAYHVEPQISPLSGIFVRVLANLAFVPLPWMRGQPSPRLQSFRQSPGIWAWGVFGVLTVSTYYLSVLRVGAGTATFLNTGSGVFILCLAPWLVGQKVDRAHWLGGVGALLGLALLSVPALSRHGADGMTGLILGLASGLFTALAYLMIARGGQKHSAETVLLHWTVANCAVLALILFMVPISWPEHLEAWMALLGAGLAAALAQFLMARSYQNAPAPLVACLSYAGPLFSIAVDCWLFHLNLPILGWLGVALTTLCGLWLPWRRLRSAA